MGVKEGQERQVKPTQNQKTPCESYSQQRVVATKTTKTSDDNAKFSNQGKYYGLCMDRIQVIIKKIYSELKINQSKRSKKVYMIIAEKRALCDDKYTRHR